jgi:DNA-binding CsgD family transcriptional regulator/tetratricopeptide (TPR) repeat protein
MELWERAAALEQLEDVLRASSAGGRVVLVAGEAGIGKSSLVTEFARRVEDRARVLWGGCDRLVTPRALGPLHDVGRQTGGALAERLTAGATQEELFAAFLDELAPDPARLQVVVVEDAHWADEATLDWLVFLARRMERLPALLVVTYRDDEVGADHPLRSVLGAMPAAVSTRVVVPALSRECVLDQAHRAGRDAESVYRLAGGNALLVTEVLKSDPDAVPGAVQDLILERIRALPHGARDVAHLVAVVPTRAGAAVTGTSEAVDRCIGAGVLVPAGDGVAYRHELLRSAVEDSLSPARRAELHALVLRTLAEDPGSDPGLLVHHARLAGDPDSVLRYGQVAGASAVRQGAYREAVAHYGAAAAYADRLDEPERAHLYEQHGLAAYLAGRYEDALAARKAALAVREGLGQPELVGENLRWISRIAWWSGQRREARAAAARAVEILEAAPPGPALAMAYSNQAQLAITAHLVDEAAAWSARARELAERVGDPETRLHSRVSAGISAIYQEPDAAIRELEQLHEQAAADGFIEHAGRAIANVALVTPDELAEYGPVAVARMERALRFTADHDLDGYYSHVLGGRARLWLERGDWAAALADADEALTSPMLLGMNAVLPLVVRGRIEAARGDAQAATTLDEATRYAARVEDVVMVAPVTDAVSELSLWSGDAERAREVARQTLAQIPPFGINEFLIGRLAYRLWRAGGDDPVPELTAEPFRLMIEGDWAAAAAEWERRGATYLRAEALAAGDEAAAGEALRILDGLGATRAAEFHRGELRKRGISRVPRGPRRTTVANSAGLTPRQADVLALLVDGLSNAEIATRLTLSAKTVDHHVQAVLRKLGVASRGQAAAEAHRLKLVP